MILAATTNEMADSVQFLPSCNAIKFAILWKCEVQNFIVQGIIKLFHCLVIS